ncbi:MAG: AI-2E family transporter [Eubacteriales bacterium]|nr:AI-2E family transporter [Eubacteriales bacterium]
MKIKKPNFKDSSILREAAPFCVAILFYLIVKHLYVLGDLIANIVSVIMPVILGLVLAYIIDPPVRAVEGKLRAREKSHPRGKAITIVVLIIVLSLVLLAAAAIPQLITSVIDFGGNATAYHSSLQTTIDNIFGRHVDLTDTFKVTDMVMTKVNDYVQKNLVAKSGATGKALGNFAVDFILAVYFLIDKDKIISGGRHFLQLIMKDSYYVRFDGFLHRCDKILIKFLTCEVIDALIIGCANAVFMLIFRMNYIPLVSVIVGVTNLIPTFGPLIGAVCGVFILFLTNPLHALLFLIFTGILQGADGYVIKPKLFGNSLGISGIWILIGVILGGRIFGMWGMLLAIPAVAILDIVIKEGIVPILKHRKLFMSKDRGAGTGPAPSDASVPEADESTADSKANGSSEPATQAKTTSETTPETSSTSE